MDENRLLAKGGWGRGGESLFITKRTCITDFSPTHNSTNPSCRIYLPSFNDLIMNYLYSLSFCLLLCMPRIILLNSRKPNHDYRHGRGFSGLGGAPSLTVQGRAPRSCFWNGRELSDCTSQASMSCRLFQPLSTRIHPASLPHPRPHSYQLGLRALRCLSGHLPAYLCALDSPPARSPHT